MKYRIIVFLIGLFFTLNVFAETSYTLSGKVINSNKKIPVEFVTISLGDKAWTMTNEKGEFTLENITKGKVLLRAYCLGYVEYEQSLDIKESISGFEILMQEKNLALDEIVITAQSKKSNLTSSYTLDRTTLDHAQLLNVSGITSLLPGGKTASQSLISDTQIYLQSQSVENGNPAFGTAIEVDGVRLSNNNIYQTSGSSTRGVDTRNVSPIDIESVEVITGIPSVEYGDLSNGVVNISTRKGRTPYIIEMATKPHTKQVAVSKGFSLGEKVGTLNTSFDHTKSVSKIYSPYTSYDRNTLSLTYSNVFNKASGNPIRFSLGLSGNIGGYDSKADPDQFKDSYTKQKDNTLRANFQLKYLVNKSWITNVELFGSIVSSDKQYESNEHKNSAAATVAIHSKEEGYFIAVPYEEDPSAPIVLTRPGYWSIITYHDSKPIDYALKIKADWIHRFGTLFNSKLLYGIDFNRSGNKGKGVYYEDMSVAPTWREYRFDEDPCINNWALYLEERLSYSLTGQSNLELMAGVRSDITNIKKSDYGTVGNLSPRFNLQYSLDRNKDNFLRSFSAYAGWGKSVKLPSAEVLYPKTSYYDERVFLAQSNLENYSISAYYTRPFSSIYNPDLKWQYTIQQELGMQANLKGTKISLSAYRKKTHNPYMAIYNYEPFTYKVTDTEILENYPVASSNRQYLIDRNTGDISIVDITGEYETTQLPNRNVNTYKTNKSYTNGSPTERYGLDWIVDFVPIKGINTSFRIDGNYYYYKGLEETEIAYWQSNKTMGDKLNTPLQYIGYYIGTSSASTYYGASASNFGNGSISKQLNSNLTITTHIPKVRLIVSFKIEASFYNYSKRLAEYGDGTSLGYALDDLGESISSDPNIYGRDKYVVIYPIYYSTWENPDEKIPFLEKFIWAKDNDPKLYEQLEKMVLKSNYGYIFNPSRLSAYYSANINITKEIGDHISVSFYANNFLNSLAKVKDSRTGNKSSASGYIPSFYYGLSLRIKI
ncbi:TonB-dependent receptor [Bacteroidales bacterium OttesenSCG-928-M11]|nr:TonB-dependent receptor [Bacteroidales bacterium OttesenSCG-928-M11]